MPSDQSQGTGITKTLLALIALIPAIATAITGYLAYQVNSEIQGVRVELERIEKQRAFDLEIYKAVKEALKGSAKDQEVAFALVVSIGRDPLRKALLDTLKEAPSAAPDVIAQVRSYQAEEAATVAPAPDPSPEPEPSAALGNPAWADWDFDLFHCEASGEAARAQAAQVASAMAADGAKGRIRVRPLSADKNRESAYQVNGYAIYRSEDEATMAGKLAGFAETTLQGDGVTFQVKPTSKKSPWYISVFLCPDSGV